MDTKIKEKKLYLDAADKIVVQLSQNTLYEQEIAPYLKQIEPYHYEEIVEERFVSKLCGYLCCSNELKEIPTRKYQISTKLNKVYDLTDRKRYCSSECYKASKYLEAQISNVPVWLRHTPSYLKGEGANEFKFWSSTQKSKKSVTNQPKKIELESLNSNKNLISEIETELKQIEKDWTEKFRIQESTNLSETKRPNSHKYLDQDQAQIDMSLRERSEQLKKKFIESIDIHKKPTDFTNLKKIFLFKIKKDDVYIQMGTGEQIFEISENNLTQLYFIEYIVQRIKELLSARTKSYLQLTEPSDKLSVNQEREREEHLEACDKLVASKTAFFSDVDYACQSSNFNQKNSYQNDNGEEEMLEKFKGFEDVIKNNSERKENAHNHKQEETVIEEFDSEAKKPMPDYARLKEEAIKQQLRIKEFFVGKPMSKKLEDTTVIDQNDINTEYNQNLIFKIKETDEEIVRVLPTVDSKSQTQIRRKIFYDKLVK